MLFLFFVIAVIGYAQLSNRPKQIRAHYTAKRSDVILPSHAFLFCLPLSVLVWLLLQSATLPRPLPPGVSVVSKFFFPPRCVRFAPLPLSHIVAGNVLIRVLSTACSPGVFLQCIMPDPIAPTRALPTVLAVNQSACGPAGGIWMNPLWAGNFDNVLSAMVSTVCRCCDLIGLATHDTP